MIPSQITLTTCNHLLQVKATKYDPNNLVVPEIATKNVAKGISRANIAGFTHEQYVAMFRGGDGQNVVNKRIGSKLHQVCQLIAKHYNITV
jgi:hypothetical protein